MCCQISAMQFMSDVGVCFAKLLPSSRGLAPRLFSGFLVPGLCAHMLKKSKQCLKR